MAKAPSTPLLRWLLLLPIPLLWCLVEHFGAISFLEHRLTDWRFRFRGERDAPVKIVYVDIDTDAIQQYKWPWNNGRFAQLLDALFRAGQVKAVGIDLVFSENSLPEFGRAELLAGRRQFGEAVQKYRNVVLAASYVAGPGLMQEAREFPFIFDRNHADPKKNDVPELPSVAIIGPNWRNIGLIDTYRSETRYAPIFADTPRGTYYAMSLDLALIHWGLGPEAIHRFSDRLEVWSPQGAVVARVPLHLGQLVEVNWFSRWSSDFNPRCSVADIGDYLTQLDSSDPEKHARGKEFFDQFKDAIVLVGPVDNLLQDLSRTSFDDTPVPQVGVHGNLLKMFVSGKYLRHLPRWLDYVSIVLLTAAACACALRGGRRAALWKVGGALLLFGYVAAAFWVFSRHELVLLIATPAAAAFTTSFGAIAWQLVEEEKQKGRLRAMFGTYVSPAVVSRMLESGEDPKLGGAEVEITAYFSDIQNFSTFSERLTPPQLVELMNEYLTACTDIITSEGGTLDKYVGDAVVAMFGAPVALSDHAYRACIASQMIQARQRELCKIWAGEGSKWPQVVTTMRTRIGLNTGTAVVGNMGSLTRFNYTMMGDMVNLGARMESGARNYHVGTMLTESTKLAAERGGSRCVFRFLDRIVVKGRVAPVAIFELVGLREEVDEAVLECVHHFEAGLDCYFQRDFEQAEALFKRSVQLEPRRKEEEQGGGVSASTVFVERCAILRANPPPATWDGVWMMQGK